MKDNLISRSALLEKGRRLIVLNDENGILRKAMAIPVDIVENAPAIDATEVVRCPKCVHSRRIDGVRKHTPYICRNMLGLFTWVHETDFCSKGERREDHETD